MNVKCLVLILIFFTSFLVSASDPQIQVRKIWDHAPHNAFTDLIRYKGKFYCTFREGTGHVPGETGEDGKIRVLISSNGEKWESLAIIAKEGYDLRDPKLSITPDNKLMLLYGGSVYDGKELSGCHTHVSFLNKAGKAFTGPQPVRIDKTIRSHFDWLWRVSWFKGEGYGVIYRKDTIRGGTVFLVKTKNGINYSLVSELKIGGYPNEATVYMKPDGEMLIIIRREDGDKNGYIGYSKPPYKQWEWSNTGLRFGGPNLIPLSNTTFLIGTRSYNNETCRTALYIISEKKGPIRQLLELPSGGDTSYPGMLMYNDTLWVSYYSSHEGKAAIFLAKIPISALTIE